MNRFIKSVGYALRGIKYCLATGKNFRIQLVVALIVIGMGIALQCTAIEWLVLLLCIGIVLSLEMMNSAIEKSCDMQQTGVHPTIKIIKDMAAGAVLLMSVVSAICGAIIFLPKLLHFFNLNF